MCLLMQARPVNVSKVVSKAYAGVVPLLFFLATLTYIDRRWTRYTDSSIIQRHCIAMQT